MSSFLSVLTFSVWIPDRSESDHQAAQSLAGGWGKSRLKFRSIHLWVGPTSAICQTQAIWEYMCAKAHKVPWFPLKGLKRTKNLNAALCMQTNPGANWDFRKITQIDSDFWILMLTCFETCWVVKQKKRQSLPLPIWDSLWKWMRI